MAQNSEIGDTWAGTLTTRQIPLRVWVYGAAAVLVRPHLWWTAVRQWFRFVPAGWWRRPPHLPVPPRRYVAFRLETAYGPGGAVRAADLVEYLDWIRRSQA
jgi:hypothetical protein